MKSMHKITNCNGCMNCLIRCPSSAMLVDEKSSKIVIDRFKCISCSICKDTCPIGAIEFVEGEISKNRLMAFDCSLNPKRIERFHSLISALKISLDSRDTPTRE